MAVLIVGEVLAGAGERGTAFVKTVGVVNLFAAGLSEKNVIERPVRGLGEVGRHTVSLSQLIHLGIIMLARVKAEAVNGSVIGFRVA